MKTYSRPLDLLIQAAAFAKAGDTEKAAVKLIKATQEPDFDDSIDQLNEMQDDNLQQQQQQVQGSVRKNNAQTLARALARLQRGKSAKADLQDDQLDQSDEELDLGLDEQAGIDDMDSDTVADEDEFTIETAGDDDDQDQEDDQQQQDKQQQQSSVRRARASANARLLRSSKK